MTAASVIKELDLFVDCALDLAYIQQGDLYNHELTYMKHVVPFTICKL